MERHGTIAAVVLRDLLTTAALEAEIESARYCAAVDREPAREPELLLIHQRVLAWLAVRLSAEGHAELGAATELELGAPIEWALQEVIEQVSLEERFHRLGDRALIAPRTWAPTRAAARAGTSSRKDLIAAERLELLCLELRDVGVEVITSDGAAG